MQFNASRRGPIIASLMQYLSSFRRLVSTERAVDKSLPPTPLLLLPPLPLPPYLLAPLAQLSVLAPAARAVCGGHFSGAELHPPNCNFVGHRSLAALALFLPTSLALEYTTSSREREFLFPLLVSSRGQLADDVLNERRVPRVACVCGRASIADIAGAAESTSY